MVRRLFIFIFGILTFAVAQAHDGPALRRVISPSQPMWIIHIDTWNNPDPQRIIDMVPEDIKPYVVFNLSLSATEATCPDGEKVCDSWMKVCAENRVWTMIQCASGACSTFADDDMEIYERYFKQYPNFLGWNFAEQFWGFGETRERENGTVTNPSFLTRLDLFTKIMKLCHQYGGYLVVSFTQSVYSANMMPVAYMKRNAEMNRLLTEDKDHFICCEKYTMKNGFFDIESNCLGAYLGGYAGQYGIRFDACGWFEETTKVDENGNEIKDSNGKTLSNYFNDFPKACGAIPILEHVALTGETVIDGPETIPLEDSREIATTRTADGYTHRNWGWFPHFKNINIDMFRKILDGTIRIPSRSEVIERTKICVKNDVTPKDINSSKNEMEPYVSPQGLYDGVYRNEQDYGGTPWNAENAPLNNRWWLKSTGRYPAIPVVYDLLDDEAKKLTVAVTAKDYASNSTWNNVNSKKAYLNKLFKQEYTGDIYAARHENAWVCYNPYQYDEKHVNLVTPKNGQKFYRDFPAAKRSAKGTLKPAYNTCRQIKMNLAPYSLVFMRENSDKLSLYMQNYRLEDGKRYAQGNPALADDANLPEYAQQVDTITVVGATAEPTISWKDNASHSASTVTSEWKNSQFIVYVKHNGPLELTINCKGTSTSGKLKDSDVTPSVIEMPAVPEAYDGEMQYEFENFDYKNVAGCYGNAWYNGFRGYYGQGCLNLGTQKGASVRGYIPVTKPGNYKVAIRYQASMGDAVINVICGNQTKQVTLPKNASSNKEWSEVEFDMDIADVKGNMTVNYVSGKRAVLDCVRLNYKGALTGIAGVTTDADLIDHVEYYDLQGMRLAAAKQGISIKKVYLRSGKTYTEKIYK